ETLHYIFTSQITDLNNITGSIVIDNYWPGKKHDTDYPLGGNWYSDKAAPDLYDGKIQGGKTVLKWRDDVLLDWAIRWEWLKDE
ncbi:MAG TPA: hypothetical protein PLF35_14360, partial [Prolixibacteraceae bacterium]|nr:hypothetical protein [Prolixibacteraceae bacterium]